MKVLVIGGMHGNEPLGPEVVKLFLSRPVEGVDVVLANEQAIQRDCRFVSTDLNRSFPGNVNSGDYETRRAAELLALTAQYDVVLDFHNTHCPDNDCGFVGDTAEQTLYDVAAWLGLTKVVVADYDCVNKYAPNCVSVEISLSSPAMNAQEWCEKIVQLSLLKELPSGRVDRYKFVYRMTIEDKEWLKLPERNLRAFQPIEPDLAKAMGVISPAYPIFIGDGYTPYNYGGLLNTL